jgi:hypothetical protein
MEDYKILINSTPPRGYRWQIVGPGQRSIKSGTEKSEIEAKAAADRALKELKG